MIERHPEGVRRCVRRFLVLPLTLKGERRWLETADIVQFWSNGHSHTGYDYTPRGWHDSTWADRVDMIAEDR